MIASKQKKLLEVYEVDPDWILNCTVPMNDSFPTSGSQNYGLFIPIAASQL